MGRAAKERPLRLAEKLGHIRSALGLSQNELIAQLGHPPQLSQRSISKFEQDTAEPSLKVLLAYATIANVYVDVLINDDLDLPPQIPSPVRHEGISRKKNKSTRTPKA